jgi:hypothetical protein
MAENDAIEVPLTLQLESVFASGCAELDLCSFEVAQHALLAQQSGLQPC